jgi:hypothetical protein
MGIRIASYYPPPQWGSILNVYFHVTLASESKVLGWNAIPPMLSAAPAMSTSPPQSMLHWR